MTAGINANGTLAPPPDLMEWLPDVRDVASVPDAPVPVREFYNAIAQQLALNGFS